MCCRWSRWGGRDLCDTLRLPGRRADPRVVRRRFPWTVSRSHPQPIYGRFTVADYPMTPSLSQLLKLPASERAELAMALWDSLSEAERERELELTPEEGHELDRRWMEHVLRPESSIPWAEVRRKLLDGE